MKTGGKREIGDIGEMKALSYLDKGGYMILKKNYKCALGEIDIIAEKDGTICFIEVKTRTSLKFGLPCEAVTTGKRRRLLGAARSFLRDSGAFDCACRMDVIEILDLEGKSYVRHTENAFTV